MASSSAAVRKALRGFEDGLQVFTTQLATEAAELRRNVDNRPVTGPSFYRNVLEDLHQRAEGIGQELEALTAISMDAVAIEELVGHSVALYCRNYGQIQALEGALAQYGYRDLYAPLPPENPLDMLELAAGAGAQAARYQDAEGEGEEAAGGYTDVCGEPAPGEDACEDALAEVTNRVAAAHLGGQCGDELPAAAVALPRTTLKALAPMTAAKALMRADTPSSLASPEAMSPSMRELLGKYAASSGGGSMGHHVSTGPSSGGGTPRRGSSGGGAAPRATPSAPAYLSPAFQLAAMEQEVQMAHAEAHQEQQQQQQQQQAAQAGGNGATPSSAAGAWQTDDAMYQALTATARKLAEKPSFLDAYRQKFPHVMASTDRLLQTIEKQRRPATAAAVVAEEEAAGPMAGLAMAAQASAAEVADGRRVVHEEESTLDLMSQVLLNRRPAGEEQTDDISRAAAVASSTHFGFSAAALGVVHEQPAPASVAAAAAAGPSSALQTGPRDKPQLEAAIAAALGRSTTAAPTPAAPAATPAAAAPATTRPALPASVARAPPAPLAAPAATAAAATPAMPISVPLLRLVSADEYGGLPSFIRQQLPLDLLNSTLAAVHALAAERCSGFTMADVESAGLGNKCKVVVNSLVKLGRAMLKVTPAGTIYVLA